MQLGLSQNDLKAVGVMLVQYSLISKLLLPEWTMKSRKLNSRFLSSVGMLMHCPVQCMSLYDKLSTDSMSIVRRLKMSLNPSESRADLSGLLSLHPNTLSRTWLKPFFACAQVRTMVKV